MKKFLVTIILFCYIFLFGFATTFVHLVGYVILADPLQTLGAMSREDCASECVASTDTCVGFEFTPVECKLLTTIRNIVTNNTACNFYVYDRRNETDLTGTELNETDQLTYSNAYFDSACPQGSTDELTFCSVAITVRTSRL